MESAWSWTASLAGFGVVLEVTKQSEALLILRARSSRRGRGAAAGDSLLQTYIPTISRVDVTSQVHQTRTLPPLHRLPPWPRHQSPLTGMTPEASSPACLLDPHAGKANSQLALPRDACWCVSRSTTLSQPGSSGAHRAAPCSRTGESFPVFTRWIMLWRISLHTCFAHFGDPDLSRFHRETYLWMNNPRWVSVTGRQRPNALRDSAFSASQQNTHPAGASHALALRILLAASASVATTTNLSPAAACGPQRRSSSSSRLTSQRSLAHAQDSGDPQKPGPPWRTPLLGSPQPRRPLGATGPGQG
eukprot:XP_022260822.1 uncharacterized protein LOC111090842 [Canis lupus familiaris]